MRKRARIILVITVLTLFTITGLIFFGIYLMAIEDHYGDRAAFYYESKQGDIILNRDTGELKEIKKSWTRIYFINKTDTVGLLSWIEENNVEVYRPATEIGNIEDLTLKEVEALIERRALKLVISK